MLFSTLLLGAVLAFSSPPAAVPASRPVPTPQFRRYGVDDGLPSSNVYTVVQDRRGVIWMGTRAGLVRFDGVSFKVFRHDPRDPASLPSDDVSSVLADSDGRLWSGGGDGAGLNLYQPETGKFLHWRHAGDDPGSLAGNDVMALAQAGDGPLWIGLFGGGVDRLAADHRFVHLRHVAGDPASLVSDAVLSLRAEADGRLWIGTTAGLDLRTADGHLRHIRFEGVSRPPRVWHVDGDDTGVRAATSLGLFAVGADGVATRLDPGFLPPRNVMSSARGADGSLWVGAGDGLYWVGRTGRHRYFPPQPLLQGGQPGTLIWQITRDREGGLWMATQDGGVGYLSPDWPDFTRFSHVPDQADSLAGSRIMALAAAADGTLLVGGQGGQLDRLDPATGEVEHLGPALGVARESVIALAGVPAGGFWLGVHAGLEIYDGHRLRRVGDPRLAGGVHWIAVDPAGRADVSAPGSGVFRVDPDTLAVTPLAPARAGDAEQDISQLAWRNGVLWRASGGGLSRLDASGTHFDPVAGIADGPVNAIALAGDELWLARPEALERYRLDRHGAAHRLARIDASAGWPGLVAKTMMVDARGRVWMPAVVGLWRYDPATRAFRKFGADDGLPSAEFTGNNLVRLADGTVYVGTLGGVLGFRPDTQVDPVRRPPLILTAATVRRRGRLAHLPVGSGALELAWNDRQLSISARALSYIDPARNHYRFRLSGFDSDWVRTGTRGEREFARLSAGDYRLQVQAAGPGGAWVGLPVPLRIHVDAPPWATPWAWLAYALVVALAGWLAVAAWRRRIEQRHRVQLARQQQALAEQASAAKSQFLATLGHEIRTPMTGVLGMAELLLRAPMPARQQAYVEAIGRSGELLLKLVNDALDLARIEAGRLELELAPLQPRALLRDVEQFESALAARKGLTFSAECDADVPLQVEGDALRIKQILFNLSNNALKFTERGGVRLHLRCAEGGLSFRVIDTGPGIPEAGRNRLFERFEQADSPQRHAGSGLGLAICRELVALMGGRIGLQSGVAQGSVFEVWLPLRETHDGLPPAPAAPPASTRAWRLLLVEDDATVAEVIRGLLEAQGHRVVHAPHGLAALAELERQAFDALLLDLDLPGIDGFRLAQMLGEREEDGRHTPIIAITAHAGGDEEVRAHAAGMDGFLRKPLTGAQLAAELERIGETAVAEP
ncbi:MAG TPA: ATP-binding protein [Rhodanobacteraceae bacterium]|nr:ATP-binding protein [Rhodanobacteraceae bacterium]